MSTSWYRLGAAERPNIILVLADDQGIGDVGVHGNMHLRTPNLDKFAQFGTRFTRFYVEPVCAPTRAAIMTGRYYYRTGVIHTSRGGAKMHGDEFTLAEMLKRGGYRTGIFGKWHLGDNYPMRPQDQGFDETLVHRSGGIGQPPDKPNGYFNPILWHNGRRIKAQGYCTDVFFDAALDYIDRMKGERFFVYLPLNAPHTPLEIGDRYLKNYRAMGLDETTARVYGMVENIDDNFGHLLDRLDELDLRRNTVLIFMTDNGAQQNRFNAGFRGRKSWTYEGGVRVPFFVQWPEQMRPGKTVDRVAAHIDLMPTFAELAGIEFGQAPAFDGRSLVPLMMGSSSKWSDRMVFLQCHRGLTPKAFQNSAVVTQRYKLVGHPGTFGKEDLNQGGEPELELYDLENDPGEAKDLAKSQPQVTSHLRAGYEQWFANMRAARNFRPGVIHLGNAREPAATLCRYQDSTFVDGKPTGWPVKIEKGGRYRIVVKRSDSDASGRLFVKWLGKVQSRPLLFGGSSATVRLDAGSGEVDIWLQEDGKPRFVISDNSPLGDVAIQLLD